MSRRPDPEHIRAAKGKRPKVPLGEQLSFPSSTTLIPPEYLTRDGQHHWERMALILSTAGLLQDVGRDKLARYCQACADYEEIQMERKKLGRKKIIVHTIVAHKQMSFWARMLEMHEKSMIDFEREYGLTPASAVKVRRPRLPGGEKTPEEKFDDYLNEIPKT